VAVGYYNSFIYFVNKFKETKGNVRVRLKIMDNCLTLNKRPISLFCNYDEQSRDNEIERDLVISNNFYQTFPIIEEGVQLTKYMGENS